MQEPPNDLAEGYEGEAFRNVTACPICRGASDVRHGAQNIHSDKPYRFDFRVCHQCGHGWIDPMPTQGLLNHLYGVSSPSVIGAWGPASLTLPERICMRREIDNPNGRYLELGVGQGHLYREFLSHGWSCYGIDPGDWSSRFPNVVRALDAVPTDFKASVLAALDVLEHVTDPVSVLRSLRERAVHGGRLYCATPNRESRRAVRDREKWRMVRPIGHVNYYSRKSIKLALEQADFRAIHIRATDLCETRFPRRFADIRALLTEWSGRGDQWLVIAEAC